MQSGKRLTLKDYFAKHTRTHKNHKNTNVELLLSTVKLTIKLLLSTVIFRSRVGLIQVQYKLTISASGTFARLSWTKQYRRLFAFLMTWSTWRFHCNEIETIRPRIFAWSIILSGTLSTLIGSNS